MPRNPLPWYKRYPSDWLDDTSVRMLTPAARGIWADAIDRMHLDGSATVTGTMAELARLFGTDEQTVSAALAEFESTGVSRVTNRDSRVTIESKRLARDVKRRKQSRLSSKRHRAKSLRDAPVTGEKSEDRRQSTEKSTPQPPRGGEAPAPQPGTIAHDAALILRAWNDAFPFKRMTPATAKRMVRDHVRREGKAAADAVSAIERWHAYLASRCELTYMRAPTKFFAEGSWLVGPEEFYAKDRGSGGNVRPINDPNRRTGLTGDWSNAPKGGVA